MKKVMVLGFLFLLVIGGIVLVRPSINLQAANNEINQAGNLENFTVPTKGLIINRHVEDGRISTKHQAVFGPGICIDYGDPYSPLNSIFAAGLYTYTYLIHIPANYGHDVVRVELFDPDSINSSLNDVTVTHTNTAVNNGLGAIDNKSCSDSQQKNPCIIETDERTLVTGAPNLDLDQINPNWFVRVDENRGAGAAPGDGTCGSPETYDPDYNTQTLYNLYYYAQGMDGTISSVPLVAYLGQTGDSVRDNGNHNTDMRWVSPGATVPFSSIDSPGTAVPAITQTTDSFEIDLTSDVPNIFTDEATGDRYLYLDVQTQSGASENSFDIWAGPPTYVDFVPSEINGRNLYILNNPGGHDSDGIEILALNTLPQNSQVDYPVGSPLLAIGPELAGQTINITLFDSDAGAEPPIVFYFDTLAYTADDTNALGYDPDTTDWAMAFAVAGQDDPDGVAEGIRCVPGSCLTQWVDPAYQIVVPGDLTDCDWENPTINECTPFYGGRLMVQYDGGVTETAAWEINVSQEPIEPLGNPTIGCAAFPIGIHEGARSVSAPGTGSNPYPNAGEFSYPTTPPTYSSFTDHADDLPLLDATPGSVYRVQNGFGNGNFGWLVWNAGISSNANVLTNSLTWPGDSTDYTACMGGPSCGGSAVPGSGFGSVVRGYIEPGNPTDQALHIGDWIAASAGSFSASNVSAEVASHIDLDRTLRLPIWDDTTGIGVNGHFHASHFGIFRIVGYNVTNSWLLLEFISHDSSCGQHAVAPTSLSLAGPTVGLVETDYSFTATIAPANTTSPVTYTWEVTDQDTFTETSGIDNVVMLDWSTPGSKTVLVTAVNGSGNSASQSVTIDIAIPEQQLYLPMIIKN